MAAWCGLLGGLGYLGLSVAISGDVPAFAQGRTASAPGLGSAVGAAIGGTGGLVAGLSPEELEAAEALAPAPPRIRARYPEARAPRGLAATVHDLTPEARRRKPEHKAWALPAGSIDIGLATVEQDRMVQRLGDGTRIELTLDPFLQRSADRVLKRYKVGYGAIVAIQPSTGKILAYSEHAEGRPDLSRLALQAEGPAASIFKVITTAALIEDGGLTPATEICTHGGHRKLSLTHLEDSPKRDKKCQTLAQAFGSSNNVAFARWADRKLEPPALQAWSRRFLFEQRLPFLWGVGVSRSKIPTGSRLGFARAAAGFQGTTMSPIHSALISASVANDGVMMVPRLVQRATRGGEVLYTAETAQLTTVMKPETAAAVRQAMLATTEEGGTGHRFFTRRNKPRFPGLAIASKSGHLTSRDAGVAGNYSWYVAFWPAEAPEVAVGALIVNGDVWTIKGAVAARAVVDAWVQRQKTAGKSD